MKKLYTILTITFFALTFGQRTDTFNGTGLLTANGWLNHNGTANQLTISSGSIVYSGIAQTGNKVSFVPGNSEDVHKVLPTAITTTTYYSATVNIPSTTGLTAAAAGDYSICMGSGPSTATSAGTLVGRIYFKTGTGANTYNIGLVNSSGTGSAPSFLPTDYPVNTPIFVVAKYDRTTNIASLFVNPSFDGTEPTATLTNNTSTGAAPTQIANIVLRQGGSATAGTGNIEFDDIRMADNWSYVTTSVLSSSSFNQITGLNVYPNPTKNTLNIETALNGKVNVSVINLVGQEVLNANTVNNTINVSTLTKGIYVVKITEEGKTATQKLIIE